MDVSNPGNPRATGKTFSWSDYGKGHVDYWRAFVLDLVVGTLKRITLSPLLFGLAFVATALMIYRLGIETQEAYSLIKYVQALLLFPIYLIAGIVSGLLYGMTSSVF